MAQDNKQLGQFNLEGIPASPRGVPQIEVTFDIDANGIVKVSAKDKATGKEQAISIKASGGLEESEIEQMVKDAETYSESDKERKSKVETRNNADALVHGAQKSIVELGDKADPKLKSEVEKGISDLKSAIESDDDEEIKKKSEILSSIMMKMGEAAYKQNPQSETGEQQDNVNDKKKDEDESVVDADFEEVDNDQDQDVKKA